MAACKLQQDNDPTHPKVATKKIAAWNGSPLQGFRVELLSWPPPSPDLSPIENVWGIVQRQVDAMGCRNFKEFEHAVLEKLKHLPQQTLVKMYNNMNKRMKLVIKANGDRTTY